MRIAALESENQDLQRRLQAQQRHRRAPAAAVQGPEEEAQELPPSDPGRWRPYRLAAAAHLEEVNRLREALAEQSTLVSELEDALAGSSRRLQATRASCSACART